MSQIVHELANELKEQAQNVEVRLADKNVREQTEELTRVLATTLHGLLQSNAITENDFAAFKQHVADNGYYSPWTRTAVAALNGQVTGHIVE